MTHNLNDVFEVADRIAVLYLGHLVTQGPASELTVRTVPVTQLGRIRVLPRTTAPAALTRCTSAASSLGTWCSKMSDPNVVRMPAVGVRSLNETGTPVERPQRFPSRHPPLSFAGSLESAVGRDRAEGVDARIDPPDPRQDGLDDLQRRQALRPNRLRQLDGRRVAQVDVLHRA